MITTAIQIFPDESHLREAESRFCDLINKHVQALRALERAFTINKRNPYIASRLAKVYESNMQIEKAITTLKDCLELVQHDKPINFQLAMLLDKIPEGNRAEIKHHLRRAFTDGDINYAAQFWYARHIYNDGELIESLRIFQRLGNVNIDSRVKHFVRGLVMENNDVKRMSGMVLNVETTYAYIIRDGLQDKIYSYASLTEEKEWNKLRYHTRVTFDLGFNYYGPIAQNIIQG